MSIPNFEIPEFDFDISFLGETDVPTESAAKVVADTLDISGDGSSDVPSGDAGSDVRARVSPVNDVENDPDVILAQKNLAEQEAAIAQANIDKVILAQELQEEHAAIQELADKMAELEQKARMKRVRLNQVRADANNGQRYIDIKRREVEQAIRAAEVRAARASVADRLEEKAKQFGWYKGVPVRGETYKILPHQMEAAKFIAAGKRVILGDEMGLGKTLSGLATLDLTDSKRALIITPAEITTNFLKEAQQWVPDRFVLDFKGKTKHERNLLLGKMVLLNKFIVVVNYEMWRKDYSLLATLADMGFDTVICDEAHVMKDTNSVNYLGVQDIIEAQNICPDCNELTMKSTLKTATGKIGPQNKARRCIKCGRYAGALVDRPDLTVNERRALQVSVQSLLLMTGSPILNSPTDMYALLSLVDPITYDKESTFVRMYCERDGYTGKVVFQPGGMERMVARLNGIYMARNRSDAGIELPPQTPIEHILTLTEDTYPNQMRVIEQLRKHAQIILSDGRKMGTAATIALYTRLRQANVCPSGIKIRDPETKEVIFSVGDEVTESIKLDKALEIIGEQVDSGQRIVLFSQFTTALDELKARLENFRTDAGKPVRAVTMTGATSDAISAQVKTNFDRKMGEVPKWDIVLANYKSGGVGLNFTAATQVIILDREWNPGKEDQALARVLRIGQTEETTVHTLEIEGSIDIWLNGLIDEKQEMVDGFKTHTRDMQKELLEILENKRSVYDK